MTLGNVWRGRGSRPTVASAGPEAVTDGNGTGNLDSLQYRLSKFCGCVIVQDIDGLAIQVLSASIYGMPILCRLLQW